MAEGQELAHSHDHPVDLCDEHLVAGGDGDLVEGGPIGGQIVGILAAAQGAGGEQGRQAGGVVRPPGRSDGDVGTQVSHFAPFGVAWPGAGNADRSSAATAAASASSW